MCAGGIVVLLPLLGTFPRRGTALWIEGQDHFRICAAHRSAAEGPFYAHLCCCANLCAPPLICDLEIVAQLPLLAVVADGRVQEVFQMK